MSATPFQRCGCATVTSEDITNGFIKQIESGVIHPDHMAAVLYAMHAALMDRFELVAQWLPADLEMVADTMVKAISLASVSNEEEEEKPPRQCDEEGAVQRFEAWMKEVVS